ncbi:MAG: DUF3536 domain-containing protein [Candidatus Sumerlaeota bacterium]|nr:DUF3536 domain-containing protein [Candidatus Sumerlaeota bacterium]
MTQLPRYICIHGHFYQPPRENPWLDTIETQDSASPFHDWNERINAECYAPNSQARLLSDRGRIRGVTNNYEHISFNFGPTLLTWLERADPKTYASILEADRLSLERREGHGNAMAQGYNHAVLPLANERDRRTQIIWGMEDFRHRFGRDPEGMWLPETAANADTLAELAANGIRFILLSPSQARQVREDGKPWQDVTNGSVDPSRAYHANLPGGRKIAIFFYDGPISNSIAFEKLLNNGEFYLGRLREAFNPKRTWPQLVHTANDGESFGHHHRFGEMALAYVIEKIRERGLGEMTNYGQYLARHPPTAEVQIIENSSWSCVHGVERWRGNCGCCTGGHPSWHQRWRGPLRAALDWLRDRAAETFESEAKEWFEDPWRARNEYISVILARASAADSAGTIASAGAGGASPSAEEPGAAFVRQRSRIAAMRDDEVTRCLILLEMQRQTMLMFTSCGWFFDEISGIEPIQNLRYAARVIQLGAELGFKWEDEFLTQLATAPSNIEAIGNGRSAYARFAQSSSVSFNRVVAHYAIVRAMDPGVSDPALIAYDAFPEDFERYEDGGNVLVVGRVRVRERATLAQETVSFAVLFFGGRDVECGVAAGAPSRDYAKIKPGLVEAFSSGSLAEVIRRMEHAFPGSKYRLPDLFVEARRRTLGALVRESVHEMQSALKSAYDLHRPLMTLMRESQAPLPLVFQALARAMLDAATHEALEAFLARNDASPLAKAIAEAKRWDIALDLEPLTMEFKRRLLQEFAALGENPESDRLTAFVEKFKKARAMGLEMPRWDMQSRFIERYARLSPQLAREAETVAEFRQRKEGWLRLGDLLDFEPELLKTYAAASEGSAPGPQS